MNCDKGIDYKELYYALFRDISKGIEVLQQIQIDAEERYLQMGEETDMQIEKTDEPLQKAAQIKNAKRIFPFRIFYPILSLRSRPSRSRAHRRSSSPPAIASR